jgi:hypothetical protein
VDNVAEITITDSNGAVHHNTAKNYCFLDMAFFIGSNNINALWDPDGGTISGRAWVLRLEVH